MSEPDFEVVAERQLILCNDETGETRNVAVRIGAPKWNQDHTEATCPVDMVGLSAGRVDLRGVDPLNALEMALLFANRYLSPSSGDVRFTWPSGEPYKPPDRNSQHDIK